MRRTFKTNEEYIAYQKEYWAKPENKARKKRNAHASYLRHKEKVLAATRARMLKTRFGISVSEYEGMLAAQRGVCKICGKPPGKKRLDIDHNHKTGEVRALLCNRCNTMIGQCGEQSIVLRLAALYLEEFSDE